MTRALMFQGTGSDVGKTVLVAGLCRAAMKRGIKVAPFKPQNMSNNAAVADAGADGLAGEIGRAQWLQALACGVAPSVHMNPVLLKPQSENGSQVVVHGTVRRTAKAREYQALKPQLLKAVLHSFSVLKSQADLILVEGAGSPAEVNLRAGDIANMGFATHAGVPVVLVGDIDRGGVIASLVGTHAILPPEDLAMICGFLINKFRGDQSLFDDGLKIITRHTGWRSFGVLPFIDAVRALPAEDSVALERLSSQSMGGRLKIAVPVMGRISNFDDLDPLLAEDGVDLVFVRAGQAMPGDADLIILPGSKSTIADMAELRANGWADAMLRHAARGGEIIGICGGYQMLGREILDSGGVEGNVRAIDGLGLIDIETVMEGEKIVRNSSAVLAEGGAVLSGYEIHMGRSFGPDCSRPMVLIDGRPDGAVSANGKVRGCYLHGLFETAASRNALFAGFGKQGSLSDHRTSVEAALDELAGRMEKCLDIDGLLDVSMTV